MKPTGLQKASQFIKESINNQIWQTGAMLPTLDALAIASGVSHATMSKAVQILKKDGLVSARKGSRIYAGQIQKPLSAGVPKIKGKQWETKRTQFEQDIFKGVFLPGERLPSHGELQARYGVCYETMRKILKALSNDSVIVPHKKGYLVPQINGSRYQGSLCLIWESSLDENEVQFDYMREAQIIVPIEKACSQAGIRLLVCPFNPDITDGIQRCLATVQSDDKIMGFLIRPRSYRTSHVYEKYVGLVHRLSALEKPTAIIDEIGTFRLPYPLGANRLFKVFKIAGQAAGRRIARMLLAQGHSRVGYLSVEYEEPWSKHRHQGLVDEFAKAGFPSAVVHCSFELFKFYKSILKPPLITGNQFSRLFGRWLDTIDSCEYETFLPRDYAAAAYVKSIRKLQEEVKALARHVSQTGIHRRMIEEGVLASFQTIDEMAIRLLVNRVYKEQQLTAWVGETDEVAVGGINLMREKKLPMPGPIALAGFDNSLASLASRLTSYDFDFPGMIRQALSFIVRPSWSNRILKGNIVEIEGLIVQRASTAGFPRSEL